MAQVPPATRGWWRSVEHDSEDNGEESFRGASPEEVLECTILCDEGILISFLQGPTASLIMSIKPLVSPAKTMS